MEKEKEPKLEKCPVCGYSPRFMCESDSSGYVACLICFLRTKKYYDFIESWEEQAAYEWNTKDKKKEFREFVSQFMSEPIKKKYLGRDKDGD